MDNSAAVWRRNFRVVLCVDVFMLSLYLVTLISSLWAGIFKENESRIRTVMNTVIGALLPSFIVVMTWFQVYVTLNMRFTCDARKIPAALAKHVLYWRNISFVFIAVAAVGCVLVPNWIVVYIIMWRLIAIFIVYAFNKWQLRAIGSENENIRVTHNANEEISVVT